PSTITPWDGISLPPASTEKSGWPLGRLPTVRRSNEWSAVNNTRLSRAISFAVCSMRWSNAGTLSRPRRKLSVCRSDSTIRKKPLRFLESIATAMRVADAMSKSVSSVRTTARFVPGGIPRMESANQYPLSSSAWARSMPNAPRRIYDFPAARTEHEIDPIAEPGLPDLSENLSVLLAAAGMGVAGSGRGIVHRAIGNNSRGESVLFGILQDGFQCRAFTFPVGRQFGQHTVLSLVSRKQSAEAAGTR